MEFWRENSKRSDDIFCGSFEIRLRTDAKTISHTFEVEEKS